jgi:peroxiredoxin
MGPDVASPATGRGVQVIGVAVNAPLEAARQQAQQANAHFPILVDATGGAFSQVGIDMLPRTYLLDPTGKILWFDIEYSRTTRRQLQKAIDAVLGDREIED